MPAVTFVGPESYSGRDGDKQFRLEVGDTVDVSEAKAAQLAADFPDWFEINGKAPAEPKAQAPDPEPDPDQGDDHDAGQEDASDAPTTPDPEPEPAPAKAKAKPRARRKPASK